MNTSCFLSVAGVVLHFFTFSHALGQTSGPEFLNCENLPVSLCINDVGIRLPDSNQIFFDQNTPGTTSCSVHMTRYKDLKSTCGAVVQFQAEIFLDDSLTSFILQPWTFIQMDSAGTGQLFLNTESAPDSLIQVSGISYNSGCMAYHRIRWTAIDSCGQLTTCDELINLYDCQAPMVSNGPEDIFTIAMPVGCQPHIYAKDFILFQRDDCESANNLLISFRENSFQPDSFIDPCSIPAFGVILDLPIWVADKGSDLNCNDTIEWNERNRHLEDTKIVHIDNSGGGCLDCFMDWVLMGDIETEDKQAVELVYVTARGPNIFFPTYITGKDGRYSFYNIVVPADLTVEAYRNDNHKNGVSTLDLLKIQKHLLGIEALHSPYDLIAADANNNQNVSAIDLVELRKLILGKYIELPNNTSWRFTPSTYVFPDSLHPFPFPESLRQTDTTLITHADFIGIKIGDVNNSVKANAQSITDRNSFPLQHWITPDRDFLPGEIIEIPVSMGDDCAMEGFQFTLASQDLEFVDISSDLLEISDEDVALFDHHMTVSWFNTDVVTIKKGEDIFTIKALALSSGNLRQSLSLNSGITEAESYSTSGEIYHPQLRIQDPADQALQLHPLHPNPWNTTCTIPFYSAKDGLLTMSVVDALGQILYESTRFFNKGFQQVELTRSQCSPEGLYYVTLRNEDTFSTEKMMILDK